MTTLYLFTGSYPYSAAAENTFLPQELAVLQYRFARIVLVPGTAAGNRDDTPYRNLTVDTSFAEFARSRRAKWLRLAQALTDLEFLNECAANLSLFARHRTALRRALGHYVQSRMAESWLDELRRTGSLAPGDAILYTWWFDAPTLGLARFGVRTGVPVVTRAHGYDLYEARHSPPYIPFRRAALEQIDRVYPDSDAGARFLAATHPEAIPKIEAALLGVEDPGFLNPPSADGLFRVLSCSFLSPVKRIDLLVKGLAELGAGLAGLKVLWTHIGDGPEKPKLVSQAQSSLPPSVGWNLKEYPGKEGLRAFYRTTPVDLFVNVSESEGTPVSLMEAISVGIPVLCTAVGGNIEVAGKENGMLIPPNPSPGEIADGIRTFMMESEDQIRRRRASRSRWEERYNAARNYTAFAKSLESLVEGR